MTRVLIASLALAIVLPSPVLARDARADIAALRRGDSPTSASFLGWTTDSRVAVRVFVCSEGGERHCSSSVGVYGAGRPDAVTQTFEYQGYDPVTPAAARAFIAAERAALAALPPLVATTELASAETAFGIVAGAPVAIRISTGSFTDGGEVAPLFLDLAGASGARVRLGEVGTAGSVESFAARANPSPDGRYVALSVAADTSTMCWTFTSLAVVVVDVARARAQLANAAGFRSYRAGRMSEALDRFTEANAIDPTHALAWHNRASVESRTGDVAAALRSETRAIRLDPSMAARACGDDDFRALRATTAGARLLPCSGR